jgi:tetratricopeptide (TPR) repeat protein
MRAPFASALVFAALAAGCGRDEPAPPPPPPPTPPPAPAPAPAPEPPPAPPKPVDERERAFDFHLQRARELASRAYDRRDPKIAQEALDAFLTASRLRPKDPVPLVEAGLLTLDMGDGATAARMLAAAHEAAPESSAYHFLRGSLLHARGEYLDAMAEFRAAKEGDFRPRIAEDLLFESTLGQGLVLVDGFAFDEALSVLKEATEMKPNHPMVSRAYFSMARAWRRLSTPVEAEKVLRLCIQRFPSYAPAYGELGDLCIELGRYDEAVAILDRAVQADPSYALAWLLKGQAHSARGQMKEAEEAFEEHDRRFPATGESEFHRGMFLQKKGEPKAALDHLRRALALDPSRIRAHYFASLCYRDLGMETEAAEAMERWKKAEEAMKAEHASKMRGVIRRPDAPPKEPE